MMEKTQDKVFLHMCHDGERAHTSSPAAASSSPAWIAAQPLPPPPRPPLPCALASLSTRSCTTAEAPAHPPLIATKLVTSTHSQSQSLPRPHLPDLVSLPLPPLSFQIDQPPLFLGQTSTVAPQGLCTGCLLWLEDSSLRYPHITSFISSFGLCSKGT